MKNYDFLVMHSYYYLQYIIEPNKIIYFLDIKGDKLHCSDYLDAVCYSSFENIIKYQNKIKDLFGLEFQIIKVV